MCDLDRARHRQAAAITAASLVREPVCDWAPRAPAVLAPAASTTTGVPASTAAAAASTKPAAVAEVLDVHRDRRGGRIGGAGCDQLDQPDVGLVAQRDEPRDAQPACGEQPVHLDRQVAALAEQRDVPGRNALEDR